jgi:DNA-binding LytR/AlgR family response regulator
VKAQHRYLIAEDEPLLAEALQRELSTCWPEAACIGIAPHGDEALRRIDVERPDVVFLDVRMPQRDGLETAQLLSAQANPPLIVFVTAHDEYAVEAFSAAAIDYLLKPIETERLARCVARVRERLAHGSLDIAGEVARCVEALLARRAASGYLRVVRAGAGHTVKLIEVDEVLWFESSDKYVTVATAAGDSIIRTPLRELLDQLDPDIFWQVHRGTIVNSRHVASAVRDELGHVELVMRGRTEKVTVSRQFAHLFRQM